jgi:hypothetical protein
MGGEKDNPENLAKETESASEDNGYRRRRIFRVLAFTFIALAILLAVYGTVANFAWLQGQALQADSARFALEEEMASQLAYAEEDISVGNFTLALRRLEWISERDPGYAGLDSLRTVAQEGDRAGLAGPTPSPFPTITPLTNIVEPPQLDSEPAKAFDSLRQVMDDQDWPAAVTAITAFQAQYPDYSRPQSDAMLYNAYVNLGQLLVMGDQIELGLFYLAQAEKLGDLPVEAEDQRLWAELYLLGISYYGVDWNTTVYYFRELCIAAPFFQNTCRKLHEALISYGDQYAANLDWCPAEELYVEAYRQNDEPIVTEKLGEARKQCLEATPTPSVPITNTETIGWLLPTLRLGS